MFVSWESQAYRRVLYMASSIIYIPATVGLPFHLHKISISTAHAYPTSCTATWAFLIHQWDCKFFAHIEKALSFWHRKFPEFQTKHLRQVDSAPGLGRFSRSFPGMCEPCYNWRAAWKDHVSERSDLHCIPNMFLHLVCCLFLFSEFSEKPAAFAELRLKESKAYYLSQCIMG